MTSQPSRPHRFSEDHFLARKSSNLLGERRKKMENGKDGEAGEVSEGSEQGAQNRGCCKFISLHMSRTFHGCHNVPTR